MADQTIAIPRRFNGPPGSANGGYTCGRVAALLGGPAAEVTLRSPPPLETLVAEGWPTQLELESRAPVPLATATAASREGYERWAAPHPFPTCVVCGPEREEGDGFRVFPGELPGGDGAFAAVWTPQSRAPEETWAALDCPTSAPVANFGTGPPMVLGRLTARIDAPARPGSPHVILSWPLGRDGRKRHAAAALYAEDGSVVAQARAVWIELRAA